MKSKSSIEFQRENDNWSQAEINIVIRCAIKNNESFANISKRHLRTPKSLKAKLVECGQIKAECEQHNNPTSNSDSKHLHKDQQTQSKKERLEQWNREIAEIAIPLQQWTEDESPALEEENWMGEYDDLDSYDWEHQLGGPDET
ncbi:MAG: hypothetical protein ACI9O6_000901 [Glaciecola sp.]|jgi:hypothetical protein